jgi:DNA polymerase elongation subunit (family B)
LRTDKYKVVHNDKCKKELTNKLLQGDTIEHPLYIKEKNLKIDYNYYLTHQIEKPVYQIFELVMKNPETII